MKIPDPAPFRDRGIAGPTRGHETRSEGGGGSGAGAGRQCARTPGGRDGTAGGGALGAGALGAAAECRRLAGRTESDRNLAAFGIRFQVPIPGFQFPELVGPFTTLDMRASAAQSVFDISAIRRYQASRAAAGAARAESDAVRSQVIDSVARAYLAAVRARATLEAVKANVTVAESLLKLVRSQKSAGTGTGIEVTRAEVQLANERQRLLVTGNEVARADLQLLKLIGLNLGVKLEPTDRLAYVPTDPMAIEAARELARKSRPELKAQVSREESARLSYSAAKFERIPTLAAFGDYGTIGTGADHLLPTRSYGISLRVPLFDGGRRAARRGEAAECLAAGADPHARPGSSDRVGGPPGSGRHRIRRQDRLKTSAEGLRLPKTNWRRRGGATKPAWRRVWKPRTRRRAWSAPERTRSRRWRRTMPRRSI